MRRPLKIAAIMGFCLVLAALGWRIFASVSVSSPSYWIWAGITARDAPAGATLYIYQGVIDRRTENSTVTYRKIGLYPYPSSNPVYLVYRLEGKLPDPAAVAQLYAVQAGQWRRNGVSVLGVQLDFDSPTAKLLQYGDFLQAMRRHLPARERLSITGLGDWALAGDPAALRQMSRTTDEIVFQLYQGYAPLPQMPEYVAALKKLSIPFKAGFLSSSAYDKDEKTLLHNKNFKGAILFIQKAGH